ncbi:hypothetical protein SAMN02745117_02585 [Lampropedia hyalina DSM 16112]|jgi:DNA-binding beta-propeller fold protein YncE|uniref:DNA-binding beta-propeller fold protein YncE n=1 Tax=Lampropedia hyalina DSM 16112 TaxID=1122156 RepID=A0A1M5EFN4_9BURK|nr:YncE family protein [Lampropedia hyalina]SHF78039.1 hypothetical protein SAMN02745117_02585 [Lampropedia hyalina DSM 16112]
MKHMRIKIIAMMAVGVLAGCDSSQTLTKVDESKLIATTTAEHLATEADLAPAVYELIHSIHQKAVFVAAPDWKDDNKSRVLRIHSDTLAVQGEIVLPHVGFSLALDDANDRLYVGHGGEGFVSVVDTANNRLIETIALAPGFDKFPYHVRALRLDASGKHLYVPGIVSDPGADSVLFVLDTEKLQVIKTIPGFGFYGIGVAVDDARNRVLVGNGEGLIKLVDINSLAITGEFEVNTGTRLFNLALSTDGNYLYATDSGGVEDKQAFRKNYPNQRVMGDLPRTAVFDAATGAELASFTTAAAAAPSLAIVEDGKRQRLYVSNRGDGGKGSVSVYDTTDFRLVRTIDLPAHPNSLALDEARNVLFVSVKNDEARRKAGKAESVVRIDLNAL